MKIGELAKATGLTTKTVRFYEAVGLLHSPARTSSGYRVYRNEDVRRLEFIRKAKQVGLSLERIKGILQLYDRNEPTCAHVRALLDDKLAEVDRTVKALMEFRNELVRLRDETEYLVDCRTEGGNVCAIIENGRALELYNPKRSTTNDSKSRKRI